MHRVLSVLPCARFVVVALGIVGPLFLMAMRGLRIDLQVALVLAAGVAVGCSLPIAPLAFRFVAIVAAVAAIGVQVANVFGPESTWIAETPPVLWALLASLFAALAYLVWWNQRKLLLG